MTRTKPRIAAQTGAYICVEGEVGCRCARQGTRLAESRPHPGDRGSGTPGACRSSHVLHAARRAGPLLLPSSRPAPLHGRPGQRVRDRLRRPGPAAHRVLSAPVVLVWDMLTPTAARCVIGALGSVPWHGFGGCGRHRGLRPCRLPSTTTAGARSWPTWGRRTPRLSWGSSSSGRGRCWPIPPRAPSTWASSLLWHGPGSWRRRRRRRCSTRSPVMQPRRPRGRRGWSRPTRGCCSRRWTACTSALMCARLGESGVLRFPSSAVYLGDPWGPEG